MALFPFLVAFVVALWLTRSLCDPASRFRLHLIDHPNERSLHTLPTPRSGGVAVLGGVGAGLSIAFIQQPILRAEDLFWLILPAALIAVISLLDDRKSIAARWRLLVHFVAAIAFLLLGPAPADIGMPGGGGLSAEGLMVVFVIIFLVWMTNLYNFMDGMDGFAGGMAAIGFGAFALLGMMAGADGFSVVAGVIAAAATGFLCLNFPPARIFMGDTGSATLGFLAGGMILWAQHDGVFPFWIGVLVFSPFAVDATVTLIRRAVQGERVWEPHRTHFYQRLVQLGWGHRKTVLAEYTLMLACAIAAFVAGRLGVLGQQLLVFAVVIVYGVLMIVVTRLERRVGAHQ